MNPNYYNPNANYFSSNPSATAGSEKAKFVNNVAGSPGSYKGIPIKGGTDASVASQISGIDNPAGSTTPPAENTPSTTPPVSGTPEVPTQQTITDDAYKSYLSSLSQPTEITEATKYVNNLVTQGKQDQETALNRGETLGFASGEAARVNRNNSFTLESATNALNALTASNASKSTIAKARLDYEQAKLNASKDNNKPFELSPGQKRYEYDPKTGAYKEVASVPSNPSSDKLTVQERKDNAYSDLNAFFKPGAKVSGVPVLDQEGYLTAKAFQALVDASREEGISRKEFIQEYASYIGNVNSNFQGYGLTPAEIKLLGGY